MPLLIAGDKIVKRLTYGKLHCKGFLRQVHSLIIFHRCEFQWSGEHLVSLQSEFPKDSMSTEHGCQQTVVNRLFRGINRIMSDNDNRRSFLKSLGLGLCGVLAFGGFAGWLRYLSGSKGGPLFLFRRNSKVKGPLSEDSIFYPRDPEVRDKMKGQV